MARLCPLFSGSSGNSYYIGTRSAGLLIDAGRSARQLENMMNLCGISPQAVQGVLVTHEHTDHISGLRVLAKKYSLPVFASHGTLAEISGTVQNAQAITGDIQLAGMTVTPFHTSHDSAEALGYRIKTEDGRSFALATDTGVLTDEITENLLGCDTVVIESNHDPEMLQNGPYPYPLKQRILSDHGHLSNEACAEFLPRLAKSGTKRFVLAHLSGENNKPSIARKKSLSALENAGLINEVDFLLHIAAPENTEGKTIIF